MTTNVLHPEEEKWTRSSPGTKRALGDDPAPAPGHSARNVPADYRQVNGWGADLDPANRPSIPRELPSDVTTVRGDVRDWQTPHQKIYLSVEHPNLTPVFGTSCPPRGLSKLLRDYAYQFGEGANRHWMTLMLADRVNILESMVSEAFRGRPDNYIKEKGWAAKVKYADPARRRNAMIFGAAVLGAVAVGLVLRTTLAEE